MSNRPVDPYETDPNNLPTGLNPAYEGNSDLNQHGNVEIPDEHQVTANTPDVRKEPAYSEPESGAEREREATRNTKTSAPAVTPKRTLAGGTWVALILGAILLIVLLVFILQNQTNVELNLFAWSFQFPAGIGFLLAAITGALIMALVGGVRMFEYRRQLRKIRKAL
ncbi:hypothetical protein N24_2093 [Corynebacterium suranareeae]|uniref:Lipopolysaccharide assembly protein A domain-containing protein n=1 Tax=Corynebacterium suranareeae TaxID=2506452 RepID=A0A160PRX4_9CORY|nr:lipopolysaccharide assembly protein LapA domain-containing protein [Corynebacterium suranareeae]BAU96355.1 hypothetical protein N24_2093 [Corynebacterium suranareeae]